MIDILVYLFENYLPEACPPPSVLVKKLSAAGFENDDISAAMDWLEGLAGDAETPPLAAGPQSFRIYDETESQRLSVESRGLLGFLEQHKAINPDLREAIIERALALPDETVQLDRFKVIVLAVIWRYRHEVDALILEELLAEETDADDPATGADVVRIRLN